MGNPQLRQIVDQQTISFVSASDWSEMLQTSIATLDWCDHPKPGPSESHRYPIMAFLFHFLASASARLGGKSLPDVSSIMPASLQKAANTPQRLLAALQLGPTFEPSMWLSLASNGQPPYGTSVLDRLEGCQIPWP